MDTVNSAVAPPVEAGRPRIAKRRVKRDRAAALSEPLVVAGGMLQLLFSVIGMVVRKPWGFWRDVGEHAWDFFRLTWFPGALAVFGWGFGAPGLSGGAVLYVFGVTDRLGSFHNMALLREGAPFIFGMVMAGVMSVLMIVVGLASGWYAAGPIFGASFPAYVGSIFDVLSTKEIVAAVVKVSLFGLVTAVVCAYMGLHTKGGASGVGRAVNQAVVITFAVVWVINFTYTMALLGLFPDLTVYR